MRLIKKSKILTHLPFPTLRSTSAPWKRHFSLSLGLMSISSLAAVAFATATSQDALHIERMDTSETLSVVASPAAPSTSPHDTFVHENIIRPGDTIGNLLQRLGVTDETALIALKSSAQAGSIFSQISPGKVVTATVTATGALQSLTFPLNSTQGQVVQITRQGQDLIAQEVLIPATSQTAVKSAKIRYSLFGATDAAGIPDAIAIQLADIFGGDIDFHRDLRKNDHFSIEYETFARPGLPARLGRILAAEFINNGKRYQAFWFGDQEGKGAYYNAEGKSLRKAFLRSPLELSRVTSGFSSARLHPVLQTWRAHKGVDYGAPIGTKVRATSDGIVEFAGQQGGYGKVVILRHQGDYSTLYGHLSLIPRNIHPGQHVQQGDTIGLTGMSGLASGPHLHYEFRVAGNHQNPLTVALPGAPSLTPQHLKQFQAATTSYRDHLALVHNSHSVALD